MPRKNKNKQTQTTTEKTILSTKRMMLVFNESTETVKILDKKGKELVSEQGARVTVDFGKKTISVKKKKNEVNVYDFEGGKLLSFYYNGNEIVEAEV